MPRQWDQYYNSSSKIGLRINAATYPNYQRRPLNPFLQSRFDIDSSYLSIFKHFFPKDIYLSKIICFELHICLLTITLLIRTEFLKKIKTCYKTFYIQNKIKMTHLAAQLPGDPSHPRPHSSSYGSKNLNKSILIQIGLHSQIFDRFIFFIVSILSFLALD